jgi:diacylglycerol kinase (ATP)
MNQSHPVIKSALLAEILKPRKMVFIVNPKAGTNVQKRIRESVNKYLDHHKFTYGIWFTEKAGHAPELVRRAEAEGYNIVVAVGGDGSINEIGSAMIGSRMELGIVPAGSGNGLAMHLGYGRNLDEAVKKLNSATPKTIDCGTLNGRPFINIAGIGFDGLVSHKMRGSNWRGFLPYLMKSVEAGLAYTPRTCTIELDDRIITEKCFAISIANGPMYGYNFTIAPNALLDDGKLEVVILKDAPRWQYFAAVPATLNGKIYDASFVEHFTTKKVRITSDGENYVHLDGEGVTMNGPMDFEVKPRVLQVLIPKPKK